MTEPTVHRFTRRHWPQIRHAIQGRPRDIEAVQVAGDDTGDLGRTIAAWCGGHVTGPYDDPRIHLWTGQGNQAATAGLGKWIVREPDGQYRILDDRELHLAYEPEGTTEATRRHTADTITDDALEALYAERDELAARVAEYERRT